MKRLPPRRRQRELRRWLPLVVAVVLLVVVAYVRSLPAPSVRGTQPTPWPTAADEVETGAPAAVNIFPDGLDTIPFDALPAEAQETIRLIERGGPFPYRQDGSVFYNRERLLPAKPSGYYREYTVVTPGEPDRGARRIVAGAGGELYYTADHYASFKRVVR